MVSSSFYRQYARQIFTRPGLLASI